MYAALPVRVWAAWETAIPVGYGDRRAIYGLKKAAGSWRRRMENRNEKDAGISADVFLW